MTTGPETLAAKAGRMSIEEHDMERERRFSTVALWDVGARNIEELGGGCRQQPNALHVTLCNLRE